MDIVWKGSPNYTKGRKGTKTDRIVVHWFGSGTLESANTRFQNPANQVSAHYGISKGRVWQWVKEEDTSYNAGNWPMNLRCVGIEHDATLSHNLSDEDYKLSAQLVAQIAKRHDIPLDREHIIGHKEVKPTQCPGTIDLDKIISLAETMTLKVQLVFNNQHYTNEVEQQTQAKARMDSLSGSRVTYSFYAPIYTTHQNIPSKVYLDATGAFDQAVDKDWFIDEIWKLNKEADVVVLVGKKGDWEASYGNQITYGHYYSELPATFPALIQIVAEENDVSWKWPELNAFVHYLTHETSHPLQQMAGPDRTHEFDYKSVNGLSEILPTLNYENINYQLQHKRSYERNASVFVKSENDPTLYLNEADVLVPFSASYENFLADFPNAKVITLQPNEFLKFKIAGKVVIKDR